MEVSLQCFSNALSKFCFYTQKVCSSQFNPSSIPAYEVVKKRSTVTALYLFFLSSCSWLMVSQQDFQNQNHSEMICHCLPLVAILDFLAWTTQVRAPCKLGCHKSSMILILFTYQRYRSWEFNINSITLFKRHIQVSEGEQNMLKWAYYLTFVCASEGLRRFIYFINTSLSPQWEPISAYNVTTFFSSPCYPHNHPIR